MDWVVTGISISWGTNLVIRNGLIFPDQGTVTGGKELFDVGVKERHTTEVSFYLVLIQLSSLSSAVAFSR